MTTFDGWEGEVHPPEDYLMHFRTKGSKNGVRRYQTPSGEWTELGLRERRKREGFGESKAERKAEKRVRKAERRLARKEARSARKADRAEAKRKRTLKGLTDQEMKSKLERAKMEAEYKELKRRGSLIETGSNLITKYLEYKDKKAQREIDTNRQKVDMARAKADIVRAKESTKRAREERKTMKANVKGGLKKERKANLVNAKKEYKNYTIRGGMAKRINMWLTSGYGKQREAVRKAHGDVKARRYNENAGRADKAAAAKRAKTEQKKADKKARKETRKHNRSDKRNARRYGYDVPLNY